MDSLKAKNQELKDFLKTGTTTIGLIYKDGVIIGTESQATANYFIASKQAQKLFKINDYCAATISGGVADCQYVVNQARVLSNLRKIESNQIPSVHYVANVVRNILYRGRSYYLALMIVGGYDLEKQKGILYGIDLLGTLYEEPRFLSFGSGSPYALGVLDAEWKVDIDEKSGIALVKSALTSARERDAGSGYNIQLVKIDENGFKPIEGYRGD
ncbi:MAG: proteasome subunit beta [Promethearchaeota archaeon]